MASDETRDVAGYVERIGERRWRLVMPEPHFESQIDVMELVPGPMRSITMKASLVGRGCACDRTPLAAQATDPAVQAELPALMTLYRDLHANPELSMQEARTAAILAAEARKLGFQVTEKVGKTGVVAVMKNGPGPTVLIRADMDALPVEEKTGLPFASKVRTKTDSGLETAVMHACGHDTHMTAWIGAARRLAAMKANGRARW